MLLLLWLRLRAERGEFSLWALVAGLVLLASYFMYPEMYNNFFHWLLDSLFSAQRDAFGGKGSK